MQIRSILFERIIPFSVITILILGLSACTAATPTEIGASGDFTCARTSSGEVECWGSNSAGQLGNGTTFSSLPFSATAVKVSGLINVNKIAVGGDHACALIGAGMVKCWGSNAFGQLGDGTQKDRNTPVFVPKLSRVKDIYAGISNTCAVSDTGELKCWGENTYAQVGSGASEVKFYTDPTDVKGLTAGVRSVALGGRVSCAVMDNGSVKCWGLSTNIEIPCPDPIQGSYQLCATPTDMPGLTSGIKVVALGSQSLCVLTDQGGVKCLGDNTYGQLGDGSDQNVPAGTLVDTGLSAVTALDGSMFSFCAVSNSKVSCWGDNDAGQIGTGVTSFRVNGPTPVLKLTQKVTRVAVGVFHACASGINNKVICWGKNNHGQLGDGTTSSRFTAADSFELAP